MEKLKKIFVIISLSTLGIAVLMLIAGVFGLHVFTDVTLRKILLTDATICVASGLSINEMAVIKRKKILGFIGLGLLAVSTVLAILLFLIPTLYDNVVMVKVTSIFAVSSILLISIISHYSKLENYLLVLQIVAYAVFIALDVFISLLIAGVNILVINGMIHFFVILCILYVGFNIALAVLGSKRKSDLPAQTPVVQPAAANAEVDENKMLVSKAEYYNMKEEIDKLKNQKIDEDKMLISKAEYYSLKEENLKLKEELMQLKKPE